MAESLHYPQNISKMYPQISIKLELAAAHVGIYFYLIFTNASHDEAKKIFLDLFSSFTKIILLHSRVNVSRFTAFK